MIRYFIIFWLLFVAPVIVFAQDNILDVTVSKPQPYIGEIVVYSVKFTSSLDLDQAEIQLPQFVGFAQQPSPVVRSTINVNGVILNVIQQDINLYANRVGSLQIEPATVVVPESPFQSGQQVSSETIPINIVPLPPDAPDNFSGAVGQFDIRVTLDPPVVQAGEPNMLRIEITGTGNFNQITAPPLRLPPTWEVFERPASLDNASTNLQTKTFEYQFFTDQTGNITIPAVLFTFFDPITATYKTLTGEPGSITVEGEFATSQSADRLQNTQRLSLKPMSDRPESLLPSAGFWLLWVIPPLIAFVIMFPRVINRPRQVENVKSEHKQSRSFKTVAARLTQARQYEPNQSFAIVEETIIRYLSAKYKQDITANDIPELISNLPTTLQQRVLVCMEQAQSGRYAPVTAEDAEKLIRRTYKTLQLIEEG